MTNLFELVLLVSSSSSNFPRPLSNFEFFNWSKIAWLKWILFASPKDSQFATVAKSWKIFHRILVGAKFSYLLIMKFTEIKFEIMTHFSKKAPSRHQRSNNTCNYLSIGFSKIEIFNSRDLILIFTTIRSSNEEALLTITLPVWRPIRILRRSFGRCGIWKSTI